MPKPRLIFFSLLANFHMFPQFQFPRELIEKREIVFYPDNVLVDSVNADVERAVLEGKAAYVMAEQVYVHALQVEGSMDRQFLQRARLSKGLSGNVSELVIVHRKRYIKMLLKFNVCLGS